MLHFVQEYLEQFDLPVVVRPVQRSPPAVVWVVQQFPPADLASQPASVSLCLFAFLCRCLEQVCFPQEFVTRLVVAEALSFPSHSVLRFVCFLWRVQEFVRARGHLSPEVFRRLQFSVRFPPHSQRAVYSAS